MFGGDWDELHRSHEVWPDEAELMDILVELHRERARLGVVWSLPREMHAREVLARLAPPGLATPALSFGTIGPGHRHCVIATPTHHVVSGRGFIPAAVVLAAELWGHAATTALAARVALTYDVRVQDPSTFPLYHGPR